MRLAQPLGHLRRRSHRARDEDARSPLRRDGALPVHPELATVVLLLANEVVMHINGAVGVGVDSDLGRDHLDRRREEGPPIGRSEGERPFRVREAGSALLGLTLRPAMSLSPNEAATFAGCAPIAAPSRHGPCAQGRIGDRDLPPGFSSLL